jgi:hypothetical protein
MIQRTLKGGPVGESRIFDPGFLLRDQALDKLGPILLVSLNPFV